ncbi:hypothetical protein C8J56DRAFT_450063 [Mycena floridula]|nr:hypothetical protein C8J56DRAFT_450063 [Mycena floridula]
MICSSAWSLWLASISASVALIVYYRLDRSPNLSLDLISLEFKRYLLPSGGVTVNRAGSMKCTAGFLLFLVSLYSFSLNSPSNHTDITAPFRCVFSTVQTSRNSSAVLVSTLQKRVILLEL